MEQTGPGASARGRVLRDQLRAACAERQGVVRGSQVIRRAVWWALVWVVVALAWAARLVRRDGRYPWEEGDDA